MATRPTTDRVREAWFSILGNVSEQRVLDLYAGTGALGIEALSRGAALAVFVESSKAAANVIRQNLEALQLDDVGVVVEARVERAGSALHRLGPFDLVLSDPPWTAMDACARDLGRILVRSLLGPDARAMVGHPKGYPLEFPAESGLCQVERRSWGDAGATRFTVDA
jgi:16S rRNA (guanine(966)-N(2))-methyltransferase RsmD